MTHTEESLMQLADFYRGAGDAGSPERFSLQFAIREVLSDREMKLASWAVMKVRAEKAEAECERLRKLLEIQVLAGWKMDRLDYAMKDQP